MNVLADTDIIIKLVVYDLLDEALASLGCEQPDVRVLSTARFMIKSNRWLKANVPAAALLKASRFIDACVPIGPPNNRIHGNLLAVERIDTGEATLFAAAYSDPKAIVLTDDLRSLKLS